MLSVTCIDRHGVRLHAGRAEPWPCHHCHGCRHHRRLQGILSRCSPLLWIHVGVQGYLWLEVFFLAWLAIALMSIMLLIGIDKVRGGHLNLSAVQRFVWNSCGIRINNRCALQQGHQGPPQAIRVVYAHHCCVDYPHDGLAQLPKSPTRRRQRRRPVCCARARLSSCATVTFPALAWPCQTTTFSSAYVHSVDCLLMAYV